MALSLIIPLPKIKIPGVLVHLWMKDDEFLLELYSWHGDDNFPLKGVDILRDCLNFVKLYNSECPFQIP